MYLATTLTHSISMGDKKICKKLILRYREQTSTFAYHLEITVSKKFKNIYQVGLLGLFSVLT